MAKVEPSASADRFSIAAALSDAALLSRVRLLALRERDATADLVAHLAEIDTRRLYLGEGYGSLFAYCTSALRLSEHGAYNRIEAARAARKFPVILELLAEGSLNLATLRLLGPRLTAENHQTVLAQAKGKSKREVEWLVARLTPQPDVPCSIRKVPAPVQALQVNARVQTATAAWLVNTHGSALPSPGPRLIGTMSPPKPPVIAPLSPDRYRLQFTVGRETHDRLRRVQDLLRREIPDGDPAAIFDRALVLLLDQIERKKLAATTRPRPGRPSDPVSRHIPAEVRRAVWRRDGGQCAFAAPDGRRCAQRAFLEFHHSEPWAVGGPATVANISIRCRSHNAYEAERLFGQKGLRTARKAPTTHGAELAPGRVGNSKDSRGLA